MTGLKLKIEKAFHEATDPVAFLEDLRAQLHTLSPFQSEPVDHVRWVPLAQVKANDYNPNAVARIEMQLLYVSIEHDGYTQPVVTIHDPDEACYVIVDGFHRYYVMWSQEDIQQRTHGHLPIVVIDKDINERMAATIRHNRARGKHSIQGMSQMVFRMLDNGWSDADICNELGMEAEELLRLKHVTGFSKLFADHEYKQSWVTRSMLRAQKDHDEKVNANG